MWTQKTVGRWERNGKLEFPRSVLINGRRYDYLDLLDEWDEMMAERGRRHRPTAGCRNLVQFRSAGDER